MARHTAHGRPPSRTCAARIGAVFGLALGSLLITGSVQAAGLVIGVEADITSLDPNISPSQATGAIQRHIYDALVQRDTALKLQPDLALSWRPLDETTWEFILRPDVRYSDGAPFTAEDVAFSIHRAATVTSTAGTLASYVRSISGVEITDPHRILLRTAKPYPQLVSDLASIAILSAKSAATASTADFNNGTAAIGTGPYAVVSYTPGDRLELQRNPTYWGPAPQWDRVTFRPIANPASRLSALLDGSLDVIDKVPMSDVATLRKDGRVNIVAHDGDRTMFLVPNLGGAQPNSYASDLDGKPIQPSPMLQLAVRRAISLAINRTALVDRSMEGLATTANEPLPAGMFGFDDKLPAVPYDPEGARKLLAEAGYPKGFRLVLHCSNGRYVNDRQTCLTVAQMLTRVGIVTEVQAEPQSTFYARMTRHDFSLILNGWGSESGDSILVLRQTLHATNRSNGIGGFNRGDYANPEVDALIDAASATIDPTHREDLQKQAVARTMQDVALVPLYTADWIWGTRKGLTYQGSAEEGTLAIRVQPVQ